MSVYIHTYIHMHTRVFRDEGPADMLNMLEVNCPAQKEVLLKEGAQVRATG